MKESLIETLKKRVNELAAYAMEHDRRMEPHLYPKGLFNAQVDPKKRYDISAYLDEINTNIALFQEGDSGPRLVRLSQMILQKIAVLTLALQSQKLRPNKRSAIENLFDNISRTQTNAFEYFCEKEKQTQIDSIFNKMNEKKSRVNYLALMIEKKKSLIASSLKEKQQSILQKEYDTLFQKHKQLEQDIQADTLRLQELEQS